MIDHRNLSERVVCVVACIFIVTTAILLGVTSYHLPIYNWDMMGHIGSALSFDIADKVELHTKVYSYLNPDMPRQAYPELVGEGHHESAIRKIWASDAESYVQTLPFYQPRVLLNIPIYLLYKIGLSPIVAIHAITSVAASIGYMFFAVVFYKAIPSRVIFMSFPIVALLVGTLEVSRVETSDAIVYMLFGMFCYLAIVKNKMIFVVTCAFPLARPDMVLVSICMLPVLYVLYPRAKKFVLLSAIIAVAFYVSVNAWSGHYGWSTNFHLVFIDYVAYPAEISPSITPGVYLDGMLSKLSLLVTNETFLFFILCAFFLVIRSANGLIFSKMWRCQRQLISLIALCSVVFFILHFLAFPLVLNRYFAAHYLVLAIWFITGINEPNPVGGRKSS